MHMILYHFSCGLLGFDIERQASNSSTPSTQGNRAINEDKVVSHYNIAPDDILDGAVLKIRDGNMENLW